MRYCFVILLQKIRYGAPSSGPNKSNTLLQLLIFVGQSLKTLLCVCHACGEMAGFFVNFWNILGRDCRFLDL
jgi:hypothetical protein